MPEGLIHPWDADAKHGSSRCIEAHLPPELWLGFSEFVIYAIGAVFIVSEIIEGKSYFRPYAPITQYLLLGFPILLG